MKNFESQPKNSRMGSLSSEISAEELEKMSTWRRTITTSNGNIIDQNWNQTNILFFAAVFISIIVIALKLCRYARTSVRAFNSEECLRARRTNVAETTSHMKVSIDFPVTIDFLGRWKLLRQFIGRITIACHYSEDARYFGIIHYSLSHSACRLRAIEPRNRKTITG